MKRSGFTMIELIFVIVILGILASVAIPKLAATRDDAKISKMASNAATFVSDAGSYYVSQGLANWTGANWDDITNVELYTDTAGTTTAKGTAATGATVYLVDEGVDCLTFTHANAGTLTVADGAGTTPTCAQVKAIAADMVKTHTFGGVGVVR